MQKGNKPSGISEKGNKENAFPPSLANIVLYPANSSVKCLRL